MTNEHLEDMRVFIKLAESLQDEHAHESPSVLEEQMPAQESLIITDLNDLIFKLRSVLETSGGDYALGYEDGSSRAADMIENLVRKHINGGNLG